MTIWLVRDVFFWNAGHGLSYTTFEYDDIKFDTSSMAITFTVKNTGNVEGAEVAQLYVGFPAHAGVI